MILIHEDFSKQGNCYEVLHSNGVVLAQFFYFSDAYEFASKLRGVKSATIATAYNPQLG